MEHSGQTDCGVSPQQGEEKPLARKPMMGSGDRILRRRIGTAIHRYQMIQDGDRIAVGVSGGKDSLSLLDLLWAQKNRAPVSYEIMAIHIDLGFDGTSAKLVPYFRQRGIPFYVEETRIGPVAHSEINRENPCFLCARLRRKRLFEVANHLGYTKVALAHHRDDMIETLLMNMFFSGEFGTMVPHQRLFRGKISIIRPLALAEEEAIRRYARARGLPVVESGCPTTRRSKRNQVKGILEELMRKDRRIKGNIFRAMRNIRRDYLP
jgi:tRNA 2-thiocytidine biosynthesis protein TtcA